MFTLIERWFPDPLVPNYFYQGVYYQIEDALACVIIAFPSIFGFSAAVAMAKPFTTPTKSRSVIRMCLQSVQLPRLQVPRLSLK